MKAILKAILKAKSKAITKGKMKAVEWYTECEIAFEGYIAFR